MSDIRPIFDIRNQVLCNIEEQSVLETVTREFCGISLHDKVRYAYRLLGDSGLLPNCSLKSKKNSDIAIEFRDRGNNEFRLKKLSEALNFYSASVRSSLPNSLELSLAYANRSAVLFELDKFDLCLLDIQRAIDIDYPDNLKYKLYYRKGKSLQKLGRYHDAELSFQHTQNYLRRAEITPELRSTWETRLNQSIDECDQRVNQNNVINSVKNFIPPELPSRNLLIPNASEKIQIEFSNAIGQHLIATQNIEPGEVLAVEKPYASILLREYYHTHCSNCFIRNLAMIPCEKCKLLMFCNEKCRDDAWENYHKTECDIIPVLLSLKVDKMELLAVRILMIATKQGTELKRLFANPVFGAPIPHPPLPKTFNVGKVYVSECYSVVHSLEDNFQRRPTSNAFDQALTAAILMHVIKGASSTFFRDHAGVKMADDNDNIKAIDYHYYAANLLLKYLCMAQCNAHPILEMVKETPDRLRNQNVEIGAALYPLLSLANHSCDPNVVRHSYHNNVVLRAIKPIVKDEQIFDNYIFHRGWNDLKTRQAVFRNQYFFKCTCAACNSDWPSPENLRSSKPRYLTKNPPLEELRTSSMKFKDTVINIKKLNLDGALEFLCPHLSLLHKFVRRPWKEYAECQEAIKECLAFQGNNYVPSKDGTIILPSQ